MNNDLILTDAKRALAGYGDTVQIVLDKLGEERLGTELAPSVDSLAGWTVVGEPDNGSVTSEAGGLRFSADGSGILALTLGGLDGSKFYQVTLDVGEKTGELRLEHEAAGASVIVDEGAVSYLIHNKTSFYFRNASASATGECLIKSASVREIKGVHASQTSASLKPVRGRVPVGGRRNGLTPSEDFSNVWTTSGVTVSADVEPAPIGQGMADKITETTTTTAHQIIRGTADQSAGSKVLSFYAKKAENNFAQVRVDALTFNRRAYFNLDSGAVGQVDTSLQASMVDVGGGWFRCSVQWESVAGTVTSYIGTTNTDGVESYAGDGSSGIFLWGAQLEDGTTPTTYQRVTSDLDIFEAGSEHIEYLRFDHVDDTLVQTFPDGLNGDLIVCGTDGSWIDEGVSVAAGGDLEIGPVHLPNTANVFPALGDIIGWVPIDRTLTDEERTRVIGYYKGQGAKGKLVPSGVELVTNGTFDSDLSGWGTADGEWVWDSGGAKITSATNSTRYLTQDNVGTPGKAYRITLDVLENSLEAEIRCGSGAPSHSVAKWTTTGTKTVTLYWGGVGGTLFIRATSTGETAKVDNVSVQELIPEEDLT